MINPTFMSFQCVVKHNHNFFQEEKGSSSRAVLKVIIGKDKVRHYESVYLFS